VIGTEPAIAAGAVAPARTVLSVSGVEVRFGGVVALGGVDLQLGQGEVVGVIGPNGAGKTTLFDVIAGARRALRGTVALDGTEITRRSELWRARHGIARTFQRQQLFGSLTVEENVLAALEWRGGGGGLAADLVGARSRRRLTDERRVRVAETLELCGVTQHAGRQVGGLPIGVGRLVELARALVVKPRVLLLDEPRSGLGAADSAHLASLLRTIGAEHGCSVLLVEHDMSFVMSLCERIVVLQRGTVLAQGRPEEIQRDQEVRDAYLG
jgi:branched-chain amino acid transport system ATP-binding protein